MGRDADTVSAARVVFVMSRRREGQASKGQERAVHEGDPEDVQNFDEDELATRAVGSTSQETPDADAAEQYTPAGEGVFAAPGEESRGDVGGLDVNEADAVDQDRTVELDEDDYR